MGLDRLALMLAEKEESSTGVDIYIVSHGDEARTNALGLAEGLRVGLVLGDKDGLSLGDKDGLVLGLDDGLELGEIEGYSEGDSLGAVRGRTPGRWRRCATRLENPRGARTGAPARGR